MEKPVDNKYPSVLSASEAQRIGMVKEIFSTITRKYDFLNHLLSLRRDIAWRRFTVKKMRFLNTKRFLDVACGTADLSIDAARKHGTLSVTGIDFVFEVVLIWEKNKVEKKGLSRYVLMQADALALPFHDGSFDVVAVAFGIRNIPDREGARGKCSASPLREGLSWSLKLPLSKTGSLSSFTMST